VIAGSDTTSADYLSSVDMQRMTGIPASTWRYWVLTGTGPKSFKCGRRRLWKRTDVLAWLDAQQATTGTGQG
jgi:hypothetical protein